MYKKFRFLQDGLAGDFFYPDPKRFSRPKSAGIYLFGLPSFIGQNEITYSLIKNQMVSVQPHYFGTYDSDGLFSPDSAIKTVKVVQDIFDAKFVDYSKGKFEINTHLEFCIGHSFGTLVALRAAKLLKSLKTLVLLAPTVHYGKTNPNFGNKADGMSILQNIKRENPFTYRLDDFEKWKELMDGRDSLPNPKDHPTLERVIAIAGKDDNYLDIRSLEKNLPLIVSAYCGEKTKLTLKVLRGSGHMLNDLVDHKYFNLTKFISNHH